MLQFTRVVVLQNHSQLIKDSTTYFMEIYKKKGGGGGVMGRGRGEGILDGWFRS
jgi:hypothetical protein